MKTMMMKLGNVMAALAIVAASMNVNSACAHYIYQEEVPACANKLSKIK